MPKSKPNTVKSKNSQGVSSSGSGTQSNAPKIFFKGLKGQVSTLQDLAKTYLDVNCVKWNQSEDAVIYLIPGLFYYKYPETSPEALSGRHQQNDPTINARAGDIAEVIIFDTFHKLQFELNEKGIQDQIIVVRDVDLALTLQNELYKGNLTRIYPNIDWNKVRQLMQTPLKPNAGSAQYDFVIIGRKCGIIFIEVKGGAINFVNGKIDLKISEKYLKGIDQLNVKPLTYLLHQITGVEPPPQVRRILFMPDLKKTTFDAWINSLDEIDKENLEKELEGVTQWFEEDTTKINGKRLVRSARITELLSCGYSITDNVYQAYAPVISGIPSLIVLPHMHSNAPLAFSLKESNFSKSEAVTEVHSSVVHQNHKIMDPVTTKVSSASLLVIPSSDVKARLEHVLRSSPDQKRTPKPVVCGGKSEIHMRSRMEALDTLFLSDDQHRALRGPIRQILVGDPGVGKTIIQQGKLIELAGLGRSVTVITPSSFAEHYESVGAYCLRRNTNFKIRVISSSSSTSVLHHTLDTISLSIKRHNTCEEILHIIREYVGLHIDQQPEFTWWSKDDDLIIDDCFDEFTDQYNGILLAVYIMEVAKLLYPASTVWIAMEAPDNDGDAGYPYKYYKRCYSLNNVTNYLLAESKNSEQQFTQRGFCVRSLIQNMRSSTEVLQAVYENAKGKRNPRLHPVPGQLTPGEALNIRRDFKYSYEAQYVLCYDIKDEILNLYKRGFQADEIAIIAATRRLIEPLNISINQLPKYHLFVALNKDLPKVWHCLEVSSREWKVVIYASVVDKFSFLSTFGKFGYSDWTSRNSTTEDYYFSLCSFYAE